MDELLDKERKCAFYTINREMYQEGNKSGKWMARRVKEKKDRTFISKIRNEKGILEFYSPKIAKVFQSYYSALYKVGRKEETSENKKARIREYLRGLDLSRAEREKVECLETPITQDEVEKVIRNTALGKSLGPDGYSIAYYKKFSKILVPNLCNYLNALSENEETREESLLAYITLILKEGKDPASPGSYRPILLLNVDTKIFAKILADRLKDGLKQ